MASVHAPKKKMAANKFKGLDALQRKLRDLPTEIKAELQASLEKSGSEMVSLARGLAPVDEGDLRDSIVMTSAGGLTPIYGGGGQTKVGDLAVRVTAGDFFTRYGAHVEYGTKTMAARPFFWPAWRVLRRRIRGRTNRAITAALRKVFR